MTSSGSPPDKDGESSPQESTGGFQVMPLQTSSGPETKLALPIFLKMLTTGGMPMDKAIAVASKMYAIISLRCIAFKVSCNKIDIRPATHPQHLGSLRMEHFLRSV